MAKIGLEDIKHTNDITFFTQHKNVKGKRDQKPQTNKNHERAKKLEDAIEGINKIEELETQIIIEFAKRKLSSIEKEKINRIDKLEKDLRVETVKRRIKEKPVSFKMKNKEIARKKLIELEKEIKAEVTIKTEESKLEILREIIEKKSCEPNTERKI